MVYHINLGLHPRWGCPIVRNMNILEKLLALHKDLMQHYYNARTRQSINPPHLQASPCIAY